MANPYFKFKQFTVWHDRCAMKVGTDGVLLGAWCGIDKGERVLDVGTGTGLIALMLAQRAADARIDAIEIDTDAAMQAIENVAQSPWGERISVINSDFLDYAKVSLNRYNRIVSNPPYFEKSLLPEDEARTRARHTDMLSYATLLASAVDILLPAGKISLIFPADLYAHVSAIAGRQGLHLHRIMWVSGRVGTPPKRVMVEWGLSPIEKAIEEYMAVESAPLQLTPEYISLTKDFYLKL